MATSSTTNPDTLVTLKVNIEGSNRRFKLPLRDLGANTLPDKLRSLLAIPVSSEVIFERYSDSAAAFITLDSNNASVYKQLYRAAKAKLKLRIKVTVKGKEPVMPKPASVEDEVPEEQGESQAYPSPPTSPQHAEDAAEIQTKEVVSSASAASTQPGIEHLAAGTPSSPPMTQFRVSGPYAMSCCSMKSTSSTEIPVTRGSAAREKWFAELAGMSQERQTAVRSRCGPMPISTYSVYCNNCSHPIPDEHYHCSTCDDGDFDLCQTCIDDGILCGGEGHWMIKRFVKNGKVINSVTETIAPRMPYAESKATLVAVEEAKDIITRTCNCCVQEFSEANFVTCTSCEDFDLCIPCHVKLQHGHNPKHAFEPAVQTVTLDCLARALLQPGRNSAHQAICDGCDKYIYGVRHKCLDCPDWDYCSTCIVNASSIHPRHRFVPIYEPINDINVSARGFHHKARHFGIYCDGPLCVSSSSHITGDRFKCAVCHDTDFCANCEASPSNLHNKTHPLIKFKTPVRNVSVTTMGDHDNGQPMPVMGDRRGRTTSKSTETTPTASTNAATQVQTVADLKPSEVEAESVEVQKAATAETKAEEQKIPAEEVKVEDGLVATFVRDAVPDGTVLPPNTVFEQTWILRNGGQKPWPAGCTVKFVGGDNMCAVDPEHPASIHELVSATESTTCYSEVASGQECGFTVLMRTPSRPGKVISYWRLTGPAGFKFGHRLWCDVTVEEPTPVVKTEEPEEDIKDEEKSQMVFPKLEKESPSTSVHEDVVAVKHDVVGDDFEDLVEEDGDLEDNSTEDGFLTDEEYDILDASDEEYLADHGKAFKM